MGLVAMTAQDNPSRHIAQTTANACNGAANKPSIMHLLDEICVVIIRYRMKCENAVTDVLGDRQGAEPIAMTSMEFTDREPIRRTHCTVIIAGHPPVMISTNRRPIPA